MNISKFLYLGVLGVFALTSCSDDDDNTTDMNDGTADLYATSHADGNVTKYNLLTNEATVYTTTATDAEGIYYSPEDDSFTIASRGATQNSLQTYISISDLVSTTASLNVDITGPAALQSARDLAVSGNFYVVSDNTANNNRLFVFERSNGSFTLSRTINVDFPLWGIEFVNNDLYAVVDTTNELAVFTNFLSSNPSDASISASKRVAVEGIVRTHGLDYDGDTMVLTDIAAAADGNFDTDGAIHVISNFNTKFNAVANGETLELTNQIRISGASTLLGNPVNVVYDAEADAVYVAELANGGGRVLAFSSVSSNTSGTATPAVNNSLTGVSSLYLYKN
tara:strand:- start:311 stop:1324 length:1014 start_codon:yes stop_codon:yes gene_type:complete